jgi:hypothetical protein
MRYIDFMVFYPMANFKRKNLDATMWRRQLGTSVFLASLNISLNIFILVEIICFLIFRLNIFDANYWGLVLATGGILNSVLFDYIYVKKNRYKYITSDQYKPFNLSVNLGATICFLIYVASLIGVIGVPLVVGALLKK